MKSAIAILILTAFAAAQSSGIPKPKPVSAYLRKVGIIFLEAVDDLPADADSEQEGQWDKGMDQLEDRINIELSDSPKRPAGDDRYWEMLKLTHWARAMFVMSCHIDSNSPSCEAFRKADMHCRLYAHAVALEGLIAFNSRNTCFADNEKAQAILHTENH